ncbi:MAG: sugar phosphate nucleotidyltransferase, partial [Promethearchaeota archaeon]
LAGGFGTRLRPLSCTIPKPMFPILNKPLLSYMISRMIKEVPTLEQIVIAVNYRANDIKAYMDEWQKILDVEIVINEERRPLGTGGAVRYSKKLLDGEPFFMLNGDVVSFFSYQDMIKLHEEKGALATISAIHVKDVSRYGVIVADENELITEFYEKPNTPELLEKYGMRPINAGTYLLDPAVFDVIPPNKKVSIEKEVFPRIVMKKKAYKFEFRGIWKDLGLPKDYLEGNFMILNMEAKQTGSLIPDSVHICDSVEIVPPVCIAEGVTVGKDCEIGPNVIIGKGTDVGDGVKLKESVLFDNCLIENFASIERVILGNGVKIGKWARILGPGIFGSNVSVSKNIMLLARPNQPIKVCPWKNITKESLEAAVSNPMFFH